MRFDDGEYFMKFVRERKKDANKGTYGILLLVAGSKGMAGAAYLAALAAYRSGIGLVRIFTHEENRQILQILLPEAVVTGWKDKKDIEEKIEQEVMRSDLMIVGPGLGVSEESECLVEHVLNLLPEKAKRVRRTGLFQKRPYQAIFDADALNILSKHESLKERLNPKGENFVCIITPHPLEMSRLSGMDMNKILKDPEYCAGKIAEQWHLITVLKGMESVVAWKEEAPKRVSGTSVTIEGEESSMNFYRNHVAAPALAKAGSGDILCGIIAGMCVLTPTPWAAACLGVYIHTLAGRAAAEDLGEHSTLARDVADRIGKVLRINNETI